MQQPSDTAPPNRLAALLAPLSAWFRSGDKVLRFAVLGAVGCVVGAVLGELLLLATRQPVVTASPQAVCLLIDCSGSMFFDVGSHTIGHKMREVKTAATDFVERQKDNLKRDRIAVVGFGSAVHLAAPLSSDPQAAPPINRAFSDFTSNWKPRPASSACFMAISSMPSAEGIRCRKPSTGWSPGSTKSAPFSWVIFQPNNCRTRPVRLRCSSPDSDRVTRAVSPRCSPIPASSATALMKACRLA